MTKLLLVPATLALGTIAFAAETAKPVRSPKTSPRFFRTNARTVIARVPWRRWRW